MLIKIEDVELEYGNSTKWLNLTACVEDGRKMKED